MGYGNHFPSCVCMLQCLYRILYTCLCTKHARLPVSSVYVRLYVCMMAAWVCGCVRASACRCVQMHVCRRVQVRTHVHCLHSACTAMHSRTHTHAHTHTHTHTYTCDACVRMRMYAWIDVSLGYYAWHIRRRRYCHPPESRCDIESLLQFDVVDLVRCLRFREWIIVCNCELRAERLGEGRHVTILELDAEIILPCQLLQRMC